MDANEIDSNKLTAMLVGLNAQQVQTILQPVHPETAIQLIAQWKLNGSPKEEELSSYKSTLTQILHR